MASVVVSKRCTECGLTKPLDDYNRRAAMADGRRSACRACDAKRARPYLLRRRFDIALDDYEARLAAQEHRCAICGTDDPGGRYETFAVDHCHQSGRVRGLLCYQCNFALGLLGDTPESIRRAFEYVSATD